MHRPSRFALAALALGLALPVGAVTIPTSPTCKQNAVAVADAIGRGDYAATKPYFTSFGQMMFPPAHWQELGQQMHKDWGDYRSHDAPVDGNAPGGVPAVRVHMHFAHHEADAYANCDPDSHDTLANFMIDGGK